ncbi:unnamed protein product [Meganyctiphanes norvegica]|uniref:Uncharacterized protein n=1 Tax=Meganyctiphanes norvegica TaxID=48144 RepID=A0AAV2QX68_MEGNR
MKHLILIAFILLLKGKDVYCGCWYCDNFPDGEGGYDPSCGMDGYHGKQTYGDPEEDTCYTSIHYDGSHRIIRQRTPQVLEDGLCFDSGFAVTCFCTPTVDEPYCNSNLCQHCDIPNFNMSYTGPLH